MKKNKRISIMQRICMAGLAAVMLLTLAGCSNGSGGSKKKETWDGYEAELEKGRRTKYASYVDIEGNQYSIRYDPDGNIQDFSCPKEFIESTYLPEDMVRELERGNAHFHYFFDEETWEMTKKWLSYNRENNSNSYLKSGAATDYYGSDNYHESYRYDNEQRLIEVSKYKQAHTGREVYVGNQYGYETGLHVSTYYKTMLTDSGRSVVTDSFIFQRDYDSNGSITQVRQFERYLDWDDYYIKSEIRYDSEGHKVYQTDYDREADGFSRYWMTTRRWDAAGNITEYSITFTDGKKGLEYVTKKTEWTYQYDAEGNILEINKYELFNPDYKEGNGWYKTQNSEMYLTGKAEFKYKKDAVILKRTIYSYEANQDYSVVNLTNTYEDTSEGEWEESSKVLQFKRSGVLTGGHYEYLYDYPEFAKWVFEKQNFAHIFSEAESGWEITYYTDEEVEQYRHNQEFQRVN